VDLIRLRTSEFLLCICSIILWSAPPVEAVPEIPLRWNFLTNVSVCNMLIDVQYVTHRSDYLVLYNRKVRMEQNLENENRRDKTPYCNSNTSGAGHQVMVPYVTQLLICAIHYLYARFIDMRDSLTLYEWAKQAQVMNDHDMMSAYSRTYTLRTVS
jgi:hypothetical protein